MEKNLLIYRSRITKIIRHVPIDYDDDAICLGPVPRGMLNQARHLLLVQSLKGMNLSDMRVLAGDLPHLFPAIALLIHIHETQGDKDKRCRFPTLLRARL